MRRYQLLIPVAALAIVLPLLAHGCSCGHDFSFHLQSWLEAASQFRHGTLNPHWAFSAAYNAGEPRFVFYPPLSWTLGALLTLALPIQLASTAYTAIALTASCLTMYRLAAYFAPPRAALLAATLYIANPYMLFTAFERTAFAELLAAAWLPLLFLAALRRRPTVTGIAIPVALLWLTNAPAAVMGCYALVVIVAIRLVREMTHHRANSRCGAARTPTAIDPEFQTKVPASPVSLASTAIAGTTLGLTLAAFYLVPAAYERRFVQIAMAIIPNMRFEDNFLFGHTDDAPHNVVLHTASVISIELLAAAAITLAAVYVTHKTLTSRPGVADGGGETRIAGDVAPILIALTLAIAFLLTPLSTPIWRHLPELAFLQFPWRLLSILAVCLCLAAALLLTGRDQGFSIHSAVPWRQEQTGTILAAAVILAVLVPISIHVFRQPCESVDLPTNHARAFASHSGVEPTDEYTPTQADNDVLRSNDPPYWFAKDPGCFAPGTTPNPAATTPVPATCSTTAASAAPPYLAAPALLPMDFAITAPSAGFLIFNLRDYPAWDVAVDDPNSLNRLHPPHIPRDDGLIAVPLYNGGAYSVHLTWQRTLDNTLGDMVSFLALAVLVTLCIRGRSRRIEPQST